VPCLPTDMSQKETEKGGTASLAHPLADSLDENALIEAKKALRATMLAVRRAIPPAKRALLDEALCRAVADTPAFAAADVVLGFFPVRGEPDILPLLRKAVALGKQVALPRCEGGDMRFLLWHPDGETAPDECRIPAPPPSAPEAHLTASTLCVLPGLSADEEGFRLGYGGGFYDRFLPRFAGRTVFPVYACLTRHAIPHQRFDYPVHTVVTEKGVFFHRA